MGTRLANLIQRALCTFATLHQVVDANHMDDDLWHAKIDTVLIIVGPFGLWGWYDTETKRYTWGYEKICEFMNIVTGVN